MAELAKEKKKKLWRSKYIHEVNSENDIKFHGPLSYRHLRIIGWFFLALSQVGVLLSFGETIYQNPGMYGMWPNILSFLSSLMGPLFLIAAFAVVIRAKDGYKRLIFLYAGLSILFFLVFLLVYEYFLVGTLSIIDPTGAQETVARLFEAIASKGFLSFNIFIDLLLCTLLTFFINYHPTKFFQGKKIYIFRLFALLPILYEIGSLALKILSSLDVMTLHPLFFPLLTTKSPLAFVIFIVMALFIKKRERYYIKKGKTHEDYKEFIKTNVNSLHFSITLSVTVLCVAILDAIAFVLISLLIAIGKLSPDMTEEMKYAVIYTSFNTVHNWGFFNCVSMILIIPLLLLFDYKKTYKDNKIDTFIPVAGIGLVVLVYLFVGYEVLKAYIVGLLSSNNDGGEPIAPLFHKASNLIRRIFK